MRKEVHKKYRLLDSLNGSIRKCQDRYSTYDAGGYNAGIRGTTGGYLQLKMRKEKNGRSKHQDIR